MPTDNPQIDPELASAIARGHEYTDMRVRRILLGAFILAALVPVIVFGVWVYMRALAGDAWMGFTPPTIYVPWYKPTATYPKPQLQVDPGVELTQLRALEEKALENYKWADPKKGVVQIPIEEAMQLTVKRGLPVQRPGITNVGASEYELIIQRRDERAQELKQRSGGNEPRR